MKISIDDAINAMKPPAEDWACVKCGGALKKYSLGDSAGIFPRYARYCDSQDCERVGVLVVMGRKI